MAVNAAMHRFVYLVGLTAIVLLHAAPAFACRCMPTPPPQAALHSASAVFEGTVTTVAEREGRVVAQFKVTQSWKGVDHETAEIGTARQGATCGVDFHVGQSYLVYATADDSGALRTGLCTRTALADDAAEDFDALGPGSVPVDLPAAAPKQGKTPVQKAGCASCTVGGSRPFASPSALPFLLFLGWRLKRRRHG